MTDSGPNFFMILSNAIRQAGVEDKAAARFGIYQRARRTVVDRARASGADNVEDIERRIDAAIIDIEAEINLKLAGAATSGSTAPAAETVSDSLLPSRPPERMIVARSGNAAVAVSLSEPQSEATEQPDESFEPETVARAPEPETPGIADELAERSTDFAPMRSDGDRANVFPIWQRLKTGRGASESRVAEDEAELRNSRIVEADPEETAALVRRISDLDAGNPELRRREVEPDEAELDAAMATQPDPLDRVAADLAAGFDDLERSLEKARRKNAEDAARRQAEADELGLTEPDDSLVRDVRALVGRNRNDNAPGASAPDMEVDLDGVRAAAGEAGDEAIQSWPVIPWSKIDPGAVLFGCLLFLAAICAVWFAANPLPADPSFARPAGADRIIPDAVALDGEAWVARDIEIDPATNVDWQGFVVGDLSDARFGTLSTPLNDILAPRGFSVTARFAKSAQRLPHFAALRVTAPFTRRAYTADVLVDLTTGDVRPSGIATPEDISVIDDGDSWRVTLEARLEGNVLFSKPRLEIFPAAGTDFGTYSPTATGSIVVGDIEVGKL